MILEITIANFNQILIRNKEYERSAEYLWSYSPDFICHRQLSRKRRIQGEKRFMSHIQNNGGVVPGVIGAFMRHYIGVGLKCPSWQMSCAGYLYDCVVGIWILKGKGGGGGGA